MKPCIVSRKIGFFLIKLFDNGLMFRLHQYHVVTKLLLTSSGRALRLLILCWNSSVSISCHVCTLIAHYLHTICTLSACTHLGPAEERLQHLHPLLHVGRHRGHGGLQQLQPLLQLSVRQGRPATSAAQGIELQTNLRNTVSRFPMQKS